MGVLATGSRRFGYSATPSASSRCSRSPGRRCSRSAPPGSESSRARAGWPSGLRRSRLDSPLSRSPRRSLHRRTPPRCGAPVSSSPSCARLRVYSYAKRNLLELCGYRETVSLISLDPADQLRLWRGVSPLRTLRVMGTRFAITAPEAAQWFGGAVRYTDPAWNFVVVELPQAEPQLFRPARVESISSADLPAVARARPEVLETAGAPLRAPP